MAYATTEDISARLTHDLSPEEAAACETLLEDIAVIIDSYNSKAPSEAKKLVSCRAVIRMLGDGTDTGIPIGASEGSRSALGYAQSWKIGNGAAGELYLSKLERGLLGEGNKIGTWSPLEELTSESEA
ncbi:MAG: hypothetical protein MJ128_05260 [Mogibacterium sp.]|nr:hypothetical protein [Mogibacterium sp.]